MLRFMPLVRRPGNGVCWCSGWIAGEWKDSRSCKQLAIVISRGQQRRKWAYVNPTVAKEIQGIRTSLQNALVGANRQSPAAGKK